MQKLCRDSFKIALSLILLGSSIGGTTALADQYYDAGLKSFKSNKFSEAAQYFEVSIKNAPWESNAFYYCALAYHYMKDYKKAAAKYADCADRFPGTEAGNSSLAALKALDPDYQKRKLAAQSGKGDNAAAASGPASSSSSGSAGSASQDKGTVEGAAQTRIFFRTNDRDKVVDVNINGKATRAIFDQNGETTSFSRQQLATLGINLPKTATEMRGQVALGAVFRKNFPITIEDTGQPARIGSSFLDAFSIAVSDSAKTIELKRKATGESAAGTNVPFTRDGKILMVNVEINGRSTQMALDPEGGGGELLFTTQQAKSMGLKLEDAETVRKPASELPQPGDPGYIPPDERKDLTHQVMTVRMKCGPIERPSVTCKVTETGPKKPTFGTDFFTSNGYKFDIDYKSNKIILTRK